MHEEVTCKSCAEFLIFYTMHSTKHLSFYSKNELWTSTNYCLGKMIGQVWKIIDKEHILEYKCKNCSDAHSLLHFVCYHQPPLLIIIQLMTETQKSCLETDCQGRLLLYIIAIRHKASHHVMLTLIR